MFIAVDSDWHLLLIDDVREVGTLPPSEGVVYCIEKVSLVPLTLEKSPTELNIEVRTCMSGTCGLCMNMVWEMSVKPVYIFHVLQYNRNHIKMEQ